ncbi:hypothetical protein Tsubulata_013796 [Turnera subulata]|uniref:CCHC-type domain-containing protein n=1 Tax=Turnera subulata TaxID=218843 RepID=A0A9Q0GCK2_9ROSI|nr:hypothetical protein Tsubulata_013796 [Turnera subulata]
MTDHNPSADGVDGRTGIIPSAEEHEALVFEEDDVKTGPTELSLCLVGMLWTDRPFKVQDFMRTMRQVWKATHDVEISQLDKNLFIFQFHLWRDKDRGLEQELWYFDNQVVLLKEVKGSEQSSELSLFHVPIWARAYDVPLNYRKDRFFEQLGNKIGSFLQLDHEHGLGYGKFIRFWVVKDVRSPMLRGSTVVMKDGRQAWVYYKYERLPFLCYHCGRMGRIAKDCSHVADDDLLNPELYQLWQAGTDAKGEGRGGTGISVIGGSGVNDEAEFSSEFADAENGVVEIESMTVQPGPITSTAATYGSSDMLETDPTPTSGSLATLTPTSGIAKQLEKFCITSPISSFTGLVSQGRAACQTNYPANATFFTFDAPPGFVKQCDSTQGSHIDEANSTSSITRSLLCHHAFI